MVDKIEQGKGELIDVQMDKYKGVIVKDMGLLASTEEEFTKQLTASLQNWKAQGARSIQIFFRPPKCHLMNTASALGFYFHHAHRQENYVLMCKWTDESVADRLPAFADHYVGVGGIMVNDKNEVLLI